MEEQSSNYVLAMCTLPRYKLLLNVYGYSIFGSQIW